MPALRRLPAPALVLVLLLTVLALSACLPDPESTSSGTGNGTDSSNGDDGSSSDGSGSGSDDGGGDVAQDPLCWPEGSVPSTEAWRTLASMAQPRNGHAVALMDCLIYVFGGTQHGQHLDSVERYDPLTDTWQTLTPLPLPLYAPTAQSAGGRIYLFGGETQSGADYALNDTVLEYDPAQDLWSNCGGECAPLPTPRYLAASATVDGLVLVLGGADPGQAASLDVVEAYDPQLNQWVACGTVDCTPLPQRLHSPAAATLNGTVHLAGGSPDAYNLATGTYRFTPGGNTWDDLEPLLTGRGFLQAAGVAAEGRLLLSGGRLAGVAGEGLTDRVDAFDPDLNLWSRLADLSVARSDHAAVWLEGVLVVTGGYFPDTDGDEVGEVQGLVEARRFD